MKDADVIVIGGGAAGLLCAGAAAGRGRRVIVAEKMPRPARKILVTGKGRCNLTNECSAEELIAATRRNPRFLYSAFHLFGAQDTMELFRSLGVPLKTERGNRVFPVSERAMDIADALVRYAKGAKLRRMTVRELLIEGGAVRGVRGEGGETLTADSVVIATGGLSYPSTGSTGDGYRLAAQAGHTVIAPRPSLIPFDCAEGWCADLAGLSLRNVTLTLSRQGKKKPVYREQGEMLFTHSGISGPLVLSASSYVEGEAAEYRVAVDLKPALDAAQLDARIGRDLEQYADKEMGNAAADLLPKSLIPVVLELAGVDGRAKARQITREQRLALRQVLKALPLTPVELRPVEEAVVTAGGVKTSEVDPKTMASRLVEGLYFAGEVLDVDARTGGFNLQIAFSTGYAAGLHC